MKITIIGKYNTTFVKYFQRTKGIDSKELFENGRKYINDSIYGFEEEIGRLGYETQLIVLNETSQEKAFEEIKEFGPDVIYSGSYFELYESFLPQLKEETNSKVVVWIACPYPENLNLKFVDLVFSSLPTYVEDFKKKGLHSLEAIVGVSAVHELLPKKYDVGFIGGIDGVFSKVKYHTKRTDLVKYLSNNIEIHKWGYGFLSDSKWKGVVKRMINGSKLYQNFHGETWGEDMYGVLSSFQININAHTEIAGDYAVNNRIFETTAVKTVLLTDNGKYIDKYFEPNKEVVIYNNKEECLEKIQYLLENLDEIQRIALAGYKKTMGNFTLKQFAERFDLELKQII